MALRGLIVGLNKQTNTVNEFKKWIFWPKHKDS